MKLNTILESIKPLSINPRSDPEIKGLAYDSRQVKPGYIFFALKGQRQDGQLFIQDAVDRGAEVIVSEQDCGAARGANYAGRGQTVMMQVADARQSMAQIARAFYRNPSAKLKVVGITGTNGKTTTAFMIKNVFDAAGLKAGLVGTVEYLIGRRVIPATRTTPESVDLQQMLDQMAGADCRSAVMEVSSHALTQGRVNGMQFDVALLTNLTRDHLDYHGDMQQYAAAKRKLFDWSSLKFAVVNLDDAFGAELAASLRDGAAEVIGYGLSDEALQRAGRLGIRMVHGKLVRADMQGMSLTLHTSWGAADMNSRLVGEFNASNLLGALAVMLVSEVDIEDAVCELGLQKAVAGRMQTLGGKDVPMVVVDYAHTPDALENVLQTLRAATEPAGGRVICVFGCGGDRDRGKRPMMGTVAERFADVRIITSDNPRSEDALAIIGQIRDGMHGECQVIEDRARHRAGY